MAASDKSLIGNRLLAALTPEDRAFLDPMLTRVPLRLKTVLIHSGRPIQRVTFPESGIVSAIALTDEGRIEIGMVGREGMVGVPIILGSDQTPHTHLVQGAGEALQINAQDLRMALRERPSIFRPLGLYVQAMLVQIAQTAYANIAFTIEGRLARWLLMTQDRTGSPDLHMTHEFLSAMLGSHRPGVTIATHVLEGTGSILNKRGQITVINRDKLLELAGDSYQVTEDEYDRLMALEQAGST